METSVSGGGELGKSGAPGGGVPVSSLFTPLLPQTIKKTRFPHWDEVLELREMPGAPSPLRVELWDWDMVGKNDFLGMVSPPQHSPWLPTASKGEEGEMGWYPGAQKGRSEGCLTRSREMESYGPLVHLGRLRLSKVQEAAKVTGGPIS